MGPKEIQAILDMLAERLGPMATKVWAIYVKQVYVGVGQDVVTGIVLAMLAYLSFRFGRHANQRHGEEKAKNRYGDDTMLWDGVMMFGYFVAVLLGAISLCLLVSAPWRLLNPEYYAIRELLKPLR